MNDLEYVLEVITPWIDKYISHGPEALSSREIVGVGVWILDAEVNNGGFHQYYLNTRGRLAAQTVGALQTIGAQDTASILAAANMDVPSLPLPEDGALRFAILNEVAETARFSALETEYYEQREDRVQLLAAYLRSSATR